MRRGIIGVALAAVIGGCGSQPGSTEMRWDRGGPALVQQATSEGTYALYGPFDANPIVKYNLRKGEPLGFREKDGKLTGVAGVNEFDIKTSLTRRTFYWKKQKH